MTQVLTVLTPRFVVQVSDRQLSDVYADGHREPRPRPRNKAVVVCDRMAISYTGAAYVSGVSTPEWLANVLAPHTRGQSNVEAAAEEVMRRLQAEVGQRECLTLVASSWHEPTPGTFRPACLVMTNFVRDVHQVVVRPLSIAILERNGDPHEFGRWVYEADGAAAVFFHVAGAALNDEQVTTTLRNLRRASEANADAIAFVRILARRIRLTAEQNAGVGRDLMATYLPRPAAGRELTLTLGAPFGDAPCAVYLPEDSADVIEYVPFYVCAGTYIGGDTEGDESRVVHGGPPPTGVRPQA